MTNLLKLSEVSELTGYKRRTQVFADWRKNGKSARLEAIRIGAEFIHRGYNLEASLKLLTDNQKLKEKIAELSLAIDDIKAKKGMK